MEMHFASIWEEISDLIPNEPVLICENDVKTWKEFEERSARLANFLTSKSLKADSKIGLYLHNSNEYLEAQFSAFKIEGVPINPATNAFTGLSYNSRGWPICSIRPSFMTTIRSAIVIAST